MKLKASFTITISLIGISLVLLCSKLNPTGSESSKPVLTSMPDTSVSVNDSFNIHVNSKNLGESDLRFVWDIKELGIQDTLQDSILIISFKNTGNFKVIVSAISRTGIASDPDTFAIEVYAKPPVLKILTIDSIYSVNDTVKFTVSSFDTDGVVKSFLWSFDGTKFDTTQDSTYKHVWPPDSFGNKTLYAKCIDDDKIVSKTVTFYFVIVQNRPMVKAMPDTTIFVNDSVNLHALGSDTNGAVVKYLWSFNDSTFDTTAMPIYKSIWPISAPGKKTLFVKVMDNDHLISNVDSTHITVLLGAPKIRAMKDTSINVNDTLLLRAFATDTYGAIINYVWSFDKISWDTTTDSLNKTVWPKTNYGKKTLYVKAIDDDAIGSNIDSATIMVHLMAPTILAQADTSVAINDTILLQATASDTNGTVTKFIWTVDGMKFDTTLTGNFKTFWPLSSYGQKPDFIKALENEGIVKKTDTTFRAIASVYAVDNDGISSKTVYIIMNFHLYKPTVKAMNDTAVAVNDTVQLHAAGADTNGTIVHYLWSLDGLSFDTTNVSILKTIWSISNFGAKKAYVKVIDDDGLVANLDSSRIMVHPFAPVVSAMCANRHIRDTIISQKDSLLVGITATDTNGTIKKYFLDVGVDGWDDSTNYPDSAKYIKYPAGGYVAIVVGAKDDDGILGTDTFHILFNRPPTACGLKTDYNPDKGGWSDFNYSTSKGSIQVSFTGEDPDGAHDNLKFYLYWGTDQNNLSKQYSGENTMVSISEIPIQTQFYWKVVAKDLFGDSVSLIGTFLSNNSPPAGIFWSPVTDDASYTIGGGGNTWGMTSTSFDNKMWLFTYSSYTGDKRRVFNSIDGINWNLVTDDASYTIGGGGNTWGMASTSFDNKMWLFTYSSYTGDKRRVFNSIDGINWNLVTDDASYTIGGGGNTWGMTSTSFDNKMWLFTYSSYTGDKRRVFNSIDGINWNLVTDDASYTIGGGGNTWGMTSTSFDNKMWLFTYSSYTGDKRRVFNSTDGINWNLVTDDASYTIGGGGNTWGMTSTSFDNKVWLFTYSSYTGDKRRVFQTMK